MKERIITAIIFALVMLLGIFGGGWTFAALILFIVVMSYIEFFRIAEYGHKLDLRQILGILFGTSPVLFAFAKKLSLGLDWSFADFGVGTLGFLFVFYFIELSRPAKDAIQHLGTVVFSYFYIGLSYALLVQLAWWQGTYQPFLVIGLLLMVWLNDTGAFFVGSFMGKNKLAPKISPKKTWEGLIGGVIATLITSQILAIYLTDYSRGQWFVLGLICSLGILGDLVESMFKRGADIKDSGKLMPGHGGVLDRFDAFSFVIPLVFLYFWFFLGIS